MGTYFYSDILKPKEIIYMWILKIIRVSSFFRPKEKSKGEAKYD